jgi:hypothetical protein
VRILEENIIAVLTSVSLQQPAAQANAYGLDGLEARIRGMGVLKKIRRVDVNILQANA